MDVPSTDVVVVFLFVLCMLLGAAYAGFLVARWENDKTREQIDDMFKQVRKHLSGNL